MLQLVSLGCSSFFAHVRSIGREVCTRSRAYRDARAGARWEIAGVAKPPDVASAPALVKSRQFSMEARSQEAAPALGMVHPPLPTFLSRLGEGAHFRETNPLTRSILSGRSCPSSAWRVTPVFEKMCSRWVFAVGLVMPSVAAVSASVCPANRLASTRVSAGVSPNAVATASAPSCASGGAPMKTAATAAGCSRVRKSLPVERQDVSEDGRYIGLREADGQPGFADAGLVAGRKGEGGAQLGCG
jgi:hypothetical protein